MAKHQSMSCVDDSQLAEHTTKGQASTPRRSVRGGSSDSPSKDLWTVGKFCVVESDSSPPTPTAGKQSEPGQNPYFLGPPRFVLFPCRAAVVSLAGNALEMQHGTSERKVMEGTRIEKAVGLRSLI
ncbi:predicted protein [Histoplasma capsulatum H143]|uniref:Uncharacterized protein n=1 Tax=Ajellomyces capsulatus (strain H143) TaxID=544712 RepID=C6HG04_AJECH|nr:predicted protein [Histoplasma capsulatum H143]